MPEDVTHDLPHGWSTETVLAHVLAIIASHDKRYEQRFEAAQQAIALGFSAQKSAVDAALAAQSAAVIKAEASTERRFEGVNEFRATLSDQQRTLMPRAEVDVIRQALDERLTALKERMDALVSERQGMKGGYAAAVAAVGLFALIVSVAIAFMK